MTTRISLMVCIAILLQLSNAFGADNGYIDIQKALISSNAGIKAKSVLAEVVKGYELEKNEKESVLRALKNELEKQSSMTGLTRATKEKEYNLLLSKYKTFLSDAQSDLQMINDKLANFIVDGVVLEAKEICSSGNFSGIYNLISETSQLGELIAGNAVGNIKKIDSVDVTEQVLEAFNKKTIYRDSIIAKPPYFLPIEGPKYGAVYERTDPTPPIIAVLSPEAVRGVKVTTREQSIKVMVKATSASGIADIKINKQPAVIDAKGNFSAEVALTVGDNEITIVVIDGNINQAVDGFTIVRLPDDN